MNILIIVHHLCHGGAEKSAAQLSQILSKSHNVTVSTFMSSLEFPITYETGGRVESLEQLSNEKSGRLSRLRDRIRFVKTIKQERKIDIAISFLASGDIVNVLTKGTEKIVINVRTNIRILTSGLFNYLKYRVIFHRADKIILQNDSNRLLFGKRFSSLKRKGHVVGNAYDHEAIDDQYSQAVNIRDSENYFIVVHIGTLYPIKGQQRFFEVVSDLKKNKELRHVRLLCLGGDIYQSQYESHCQSLGLSFQKFDSDGDIDLANFDVAYLGFRNNPVSYLKYASLFVLTSAYEGFPNALAEAMICGKIVLSTDCEVGPRDLITPDYIDKDIEYPHVGENGIVLPVFEDYSMILGSASFAHVKWQDTIRQIVEDRSSFDKLGQNAKTSMTKYSIKNYRSRWEELLETL